MHRINGLNSSQELAIFPQRVSRPVIQAVDLISEGPTEIGVAHSFPQNIYVINYLSRNSLSGTGPIASAVPIQSAESVQVDTVRIRNRNIKPILQDCSFVVGLVSFVALGSYLVFRYCVYSNN